MRKKLILLVCGLVLVLVFGTYLYFTPHLTVREMRSAAERFDAAKLSEHVDYPAVRESLKSEIRTRINSAPGAESGLGSLGAAIAGAFVDPMVETLVNPESIARMLQGVAPNEQGASAGGEPLVNASMGYNGFSEFVVTIAPVHAPSMAFDFILSRDGLLGWKLTGVRLPQAWTLPSPAAPV